MNRDQITAWAREANFEELVVDEVIHYNELAHFAALVAAAEREACAKELEEDASHYVSAGTVGHTISKCAAAIRARGQATNNPDANSLE